MSKNFQNREPTEWVNSWLSHADCEGDRILLNGDSVTRGLRGKLEFYIKKWYKVDLFASSFAITDNLFWRNLQCFFNDEYKYQIIFINYNYHHGYIGEYAENEEVLQRLYQKLIYLCQSLCDRVIVMTGTSCMKPEHLEQLDEDVEYGIHMRNEIAKKAAENTGCVLFDLHHVMKQGFGINFRYVDHVHFENNAYFYIAYKMLVSLSILNKEKKEKAQTLIYRSLEIEKPTKSIVYLGKNVGRGRNEYQLFFLLKYFCQDIRIVAWAVTDGNNADKEICGIPVCEIEQLRDKKSLLIILANEQEEAKMRLTAEELGFNKIKSYNSMLSELFL